MKIRPRSFGLAPLHNREGTGFWPVFQKAEREVREETAAFLKKGRTPEKLRAFQEQMAKRHWRR